MLQFYIFMQYANILIELRLGIPQYLETACFGRIYETLSEVKDCDKHQLQANEKKIWINQLQKKVS